MNICITGSTGRLGSVLCRHFRESGDEVIAFSQTPGAQRRSISSLPDFLRAEKADCVLHLAWSTVPATSEAAEGQEFKVDLPLLETILEGLRQSKEKSPLFVFFSTCAVYGEQTDAKYPFSEEDALRPKGSYARGKVAAEQLIAKYASNFGLRTLVLRVSNPYGFAQHAGCRQGVIPALVRAALTREEIELWGSGEQRKDYLHIDDLRAAVELSMRAGVTGTLNVASGQSVALTRVISLIESESGREVYARRAPARAWDVQNAEYCNAAISVTAGWRPRIDFEQGLTSFVRRICTEN